jgi:hypothetical protein
MTRACVLAVRCSPRRAGRPNGRGSSLDPRDAGALPASSSSEAPRPARSILGEISSHREPPDIETAEQHYRQGLALAAEVACAPSSPTLGLGKLYWRTGKCEQAQEQLTTAMAMYRDGMTYWLEQAEAELRQLG